VVAESAARAISETIGITDKGIDMVEWQGIPLTLAQTGERPGGGEGNGGGGAPAPAPAPATTNGGDGGGAPREGAGDGQPAGGRDGGGQPGAGNWTLPALLLIFLVVMVGMTIFSQRREKKKRQALIESISKDDRVVTIGGIIGTVVEIRDNEVVLKVDESSNTRLKFSKSAIQGVVGETE